MTELQEKLLSLVLEIDAICKKNNIEYYLDGGSVLGAIRHRGFIPWDDDFDIVMTRPNWEKFISIIDKELPKNRTLDTPDRNLKYPTTSRRYSDTSTTSIFKSLMFDVCSCGVCIDIFVLEALPDSKEKQSEYIKNLYSYIEYIQAYYIVKEKSDSIDYLENIVLSKKMSENEIRKYLFNKIDTIKEFDNCNQLIIRWGGNGPQIYNKDIFGKPKYVKFENTYLPVPEKTYEYLLTQFGEDWYIEPKDKVSEHETVNNLYISSNNYINDISGFVNFKKARKTFRKIKNKKMFYKIKKNSYQNYVYDISNVLKSQKINSISTSKLNELLKTNKNDEYNEILKEYTDYQTNNDIIYYEKILNIDDKYKYYILLSILKNGNFKKFDKIINILNKEENLNSRKIEQLIKSKSLYNDSLCYYFNDNYNKALKSIKDAMRMVPNIKKYEELFNIINKIK